MKRIERGWAGHFCASEHCRFRRNTLIVHSRRRIVVSTVGAMYIDGVLEPLAVEPPRYYETIICWAERESPYWEADMCRPVITPLRVKLSITGCTYGMDLKADAMHERAVAWAMQFLDRGGNPQ